MGAWQNTDGVIPVDKGKLRKTIRKKVVEILKGNTAVGDRVFPNASIPPWSDELPVILVYPRSESASEYADAPRELERELSLELELIAAGPEENEDAGSPENLEKSLEDILDDLAEEVEGLLAADETFGGVCDDSVLTNTEFEFDRSGAQPIGSARLTYLVTYYTMSPRTEPTQPDFETNKVDYNIGEDENTREATDTVDMDT